MTTTVGQRPAGAKPATIPARRRRSAWTVLRENVVWVVAALALVYLLLPNLVVVLFSFNKPNGRFNYTWQRFSLDAWLHPCAAPGMCESLSLSLKIGVVATVVATLLGTMIAFALARYRFHGRAGSNLLIFLPMATPEVVMGSSLLTLFVSMGIPLGRVTILIAHIMFCLSYVVVTVKARIAGLDPRLEQAAADLYANEWQTFRRITLPLVAPGIAAGALLAFSLSFDDYIVTNFNASNASITFPMYVWGAAARGTPVQINVIGTAMFVLAVLAVALGQLAGRRRSRAH
ncbi:MAG: spermidine/putrescine transport system permease protein [Pseudonocardiales bacterium]|jgi:spermidine/putrescine transport system permease protein|nr:spermidine/putrescine transport system permease protein [Pseudonocardiales bacterium]